jgi:hypothetical protein
MAFNMGRNGTSRPASVEIYPKFLEMGPLRQPGGLGRPLSSATATETATNLVSHA